MAGINYQILTDILTKLDFVFNSSMEKLSDRINDQQGAEEGQPVDNTLQADMLQLQTWYSTTVTTAIGGFSEASDAAKTAANKAS